MLRLWLWGKKNTQEVQKLKEKAGIITKKDRVDSIVVSNFKKQIDSDMRELQKRGFEHVIELMDLPLSRLSDEAKQKILQIAKDDLDNQYKLQDELIEQNINKILS